jgi:two-component system response regulator PilR (NtrC family)
VRELENILERALALADEDRIDADDLRLPIAMPSAASEASAPAAPGAPPAPSAARDPRTVSPYESATTALPSYIEEVERQAIEQALQDNRFNKTKAARALGITFRALRYKLKKLGID